MAVTDKNTLLGWFVKGAKPLASQFAAWMNSYWHKSESIPVENISGLQEELDKKADKELLAHLDDTKSLIVAKYGLNSLVVAQPIAFPFAIEIISCTLSADAVSASFKIVDEIYDQTSIIDIVIPANTTFYIDDIDIAAGKENGSINVQFRKITV